MVRTRKVKVELPTEVSNCWDCPFLIFHGIRVGDSTRTCEYSCRRAGTGPKNAITFKVAQAEAQDLGDLSSIMPIPKRCPLRNAR
jgi:hypothetical protein